MTCGHCYKIGMIKKCTEHKTYAHKRINMKGLLTHNGTVPVSMFATWKRQKTMLEAKKRLNFDAEM